MYVDGFGVAKIDGDGSAHRDAVYHAQGERHALRPVHDLGLRFVGKLYHAGSWHGEFVFIQNEMAGQINLIFA